MQGAHWEASGLEGGEARRVTHEGEEEVALRAKGQVSAGWSVPMVHVPRKL